MEKSGDKYYQGEESFTEIMEKIMKSMSLDEPKFSTTSNYGNLVSHYCESPKNDASERLSRSVSGSGEFPTPDKKTLGHNLASSPEKQNDRSLDVTALVAEAQVKSHLIVDEFMRSICIHESNLKRIKFV